MDFWARLIGGSPKKQSLENNPQQRLARFRKIYNQILQTWHKTSSLASDPSAAELVRVSFQRLTSILHDESRSPAPHLCLSFASSSKIYTAVSRIASTAHNEWVVKEAVALFAALVDSEEEDFLENGTFSQSLMTFVSKVTGRGAIMVVGEDTEAEVVELLFGIAAKIRLQPEILPVWFTTRTKDMNDGASILQKADFAGITQKEDFPLCYQLIDHVHHEGRIGDFSRTGLLYIFESASKSKELEHWIVESDLATLMASSLGALYSQLSRKLTILHPKSEMPIILSLSDYLELKPSSEADSLFSPDYQMHMSTFLSFLTFWQDVLEHCRSLDVRQTLIDHFQVLFLQQLLYPSLLESSDVDGGSAVAVLTYLRRILDSLDHPELVHMILHYLLALPDSMAPIPGRSSLAQGKRNSLMLLTISSEDDDRLNPSLFNLVDLVLSSAESHNTQTVIAVMRLISVLLHKNHDYAMGTLLQVIEIRPREPQRTVGALNAEMGVYLELASAIAGDNGMDESYALHLTDMQTLLEIHPCSNRRLTSQLKQNGRTSDLVGIRPTQPHLLAPEDALLDRLLRLLRTFFTNNVEANLALTETVVTLASCCQLQLEGWIAVEPVRYGFADESPYDPIPELDDESVRNIYKARREPHWTPSYSPSIMLTLQGLSTQLDRLRAHVPDLDSHITNRKQAFRVHDEISEAMANMPAPHQVELQPNSWTPQIPRHVLEQSTPSRTQSPRGRKEALSVSQQSAQSSPSRSSRIDRRTLLNSPTPTSRGMSPASKNARPPQTLMVDVTGAIDAVAQDETLKRRVRFITKGQVVTVEVFSEMFEAAPEQHSSQAASREISRNRSQQRKPDEVPANVDDSEVPDDSEVLDDSTLDESEVADDSVVDDSEIDQSEVVQEEEEVVAEASLSHVLTNAVILQEFILQIVAIMQIRASLFDEVKFG